MINLLLGAPGAGKSYEAVVFHILPALLRGRKVITNLPLNLEAFAAIDGNLPGLIEVREKTLATPPEPLTREQVMTQTKAEQEQRSRWSLRAFANPEDFASDWRQETDGKGPLYVVDECHFAMPVGRTQIGVEEWFSMHRHYNADVLLITQSSNKISRAIRDLVQVCYKVRKAVALGNADGYIRKVLDGVGGGEVATSTRNYQAQYFPLWRSHTQGVAVAEVKADDVAPLAVKFKRFSWAFYALTACVCIWAFWPAGDKKPEVARSKPAAGVVVAVKADAQGVGTVKPEKTPVAAVPEGPEETPDPYASKGLHLTGRMTMRGRVLYAFAVSDSGKRIDSLTSDDLQRIGYVWQPMTDCAGTLRWKNKAKPVTCDAPVVPQGSKSDPVVVGLPKGASPASSSQPLGSM